MSWIIATPWAISPRAAIPGSWVSERHLRPALAAGRGALGDRLGRCAERLAEPAAELPRRLGCAAAAEAERPLRAVLRPAREAREQEREDQQDDAQRDDSPDYHALRATQ